MIGYVKCFDDNKTMSFKAIDNKLLKKYTQKWKKVRTLLNIKFDSEPVYGDNYKYIKTKIKIYGDKVNTNFQGNLIMRLTMNLTLNNLLINLLITIKV